eukprot:9898848-Lingulodinium_polyedra.AAC.1
MIPSTSEHETGSRSTKIGTLAHYYGQQKTPAINLPAQHRGPAQIIASEPATTRSRESSSG